MKRIKRLLLLPLVFVLALALAGCGNGGVSEQAGIAAGSAPSEAQSALAEADPTPKPTAEPESEAETPAVEESGDKESEAPVSGESEGESGGNILVVYFSRTGEQYGVGVIDKGNTEIVAERIAERTGADLYQILPTQDYPTTYDDLTDVAKREQNENARPAMAGEPPDLSGYDTIFIGAPVWWGDWPMICYTFFESADLGGKTLYPFSTHAGSGLSGFDRKLSSAVPGATVGEGLAVAGTDCQNDPDGVKSAVDGWLSGLGF